MVAAGETAQAGKMPGERIATAIATADSANFTAETQLMSVTAALVTGRIYRVKVHSRVNSSVSGDRIITRIREDSISGTEIQSTNVPINANGPANGYQDNLEAEFTAVSTGNKTFSYTGERVGTGNGTLEAATSRPSYLYVDYIRGP